MIVYERIWKTMKQKNISQYKLIKEYKISSGQLDRLRKNENINTYTLNQLCKISYFDLTNFCFELLGFSGNVNFNLPLSING